MKLNNRQLATVREMYRLVMAYRLDTAVADDAAYRRMMLILSGATHSI
jgi:hypothetical protein